MGLGISVVFKALRYSNGPPGLRTADVNHEDISPRR
jgi:hypothetical protein